MMKRLKTRFLTVLMSFFILVNSIVVQPMQVQAAALPITFGLVEIVKGLLFSAGVSILGYTALNNVKKGDDTYNKIMDSVTSDADVQSMLEELEQYDTSGSCHQLEDGEEYVSDKGFRVIKGGKGSDNNNNDANKYALGVSTAIAQKVAESIKNFIDSDDNKQTVTIKTPYDEYIETNYLKKSYDSLNDIASLYGSEVLNKLNEKGYTDENCSVVMYLDNSSTKSFFVFIPVPEDCSFIGYVGNTKTEYTCYSTTLSVLKTDELLQMLSGDVPSSEFDDYIYSRRLPFDAVYYDYINNTFLEYEELNENSMCKKRELRNGDVRHYGDYFQDNIKAIFNFDDMASNTHLWAKIYSKYWDIYSMFPQSVSYAISKKPDSIPLELPKSGYVNINFDEDTASDLAAQPDINQYFNYVINNSPDLSEVIDNMNNNQAQDNANAQGIIGAIKQQTIDLLNGIKNAILGALEAAVVPDLDYWKAELDARTEQVKENASILLLPLTIITIVFAVFDTENIGDFILEIPQLIVKDYVIFEGYSLNVNQFMQQDFLSWFYNIYLLITDVMIIFWIANYAARKFTTIIEGN